nr:MAG TPA: hypothetical protein [Caudoviricetes sp.]
MGGPCGLHFSQSSSEVFALDDFFQSRFACRHFGVMGSSCPRLSFEVGRRARIFGQHSRNIVRGTWAHAQATASIGPHKCGCKLAIPLFNLLLSRPDFRQPGNGIDAGLPLGLSLDPGIPAGQQHRHDLRLLRLDRVDCAILLSLRQRLDFDPAIRDQAFAPFQSLTKRDVISFNQFHSCHFCFLQFSGGFCPSICTIIIAVFPAFVKSFFAKTGKNIMRSISLIFAPYPIIIKVAGVRLPAHLIWGGRAALLE